MVHVCHDAGRAPPSVIRVSLLAPRVTINVISAQLPEARRVAFGKLERVYPFGRLPEIQVWDEESCWATMVAWKRLPLVVQSDHGLSGGKICKGDICRVAIVAVCEHEISGALHAGRSEEHTSELQSLMRISYAVFCLKKKKQTTDKTYTNPH